MAEDLYEVLKIARGSSQPEIKRAYREIARKYHPDKNPGDNDAARIFAAAAEAYRVLGDSETRQQYDRYGRASAGHSNAAPENAGDLFRDIFGAKKSAPPTGSQGRRPAAPPPERGDDLRYTLEIDFAEATSGCEREIDVLRNERCGSCAGTGAQAGSAPQICQACRGSGTRREDQGFFTNSSPCTECDGSGRKVSSTCRECGGKGRSRVEARVTVAVPGGVDTGTRLRLTGEGNAGADGGPNGDLFVVIQLGEHPFFQREEDDVLTEVPVRFVDAAIGATIEVPTLEGKVRMKIPGGSQHGRVFRLKGKGIANAQGGRGDLRVRIAVEIPRFVSPEQRELLERYADLDEQHDENPVVRDYLERLERHFSPGSKH